MKINKGMMIALFVGGYLWWKVKEVVNALHSKIVKVRILNFWSNLRKGVYELELTFLLENTSKLDMTVNQFVGRMDWRGNLMAKIDLQWDDTPILPGQLQEVPFSVRGNLSSGIAAIILAVQNPGSRLLDGVTVDGKMMITVNGKRGTLPYHQEISITL